jgi:hypothetical protein
MSPDGRAAGGEPVVRNVPGRVVEVFAVTRLTGLLDVRPGGGRRPA